MPDEDEVIDSNDTKAAAQGRRDLAEGRTYCMDEVQADVRLKCRG